MNTVSFAGQVVLVTGGSRGVGLGIVRGFLAAGASVVTCGRAETADVPARYLRADVRDVSQVDVLVSTVVAEFGRLDVVVNNAGGAPPAEAATASPRLHEKIVALNLLAPLHVSQRANAVMQQQDPGGVIVMIGSVSGTRPSPGTAAYGAAKAGLANLATSLAVEWAPKVRVNTVVVGPVDTELSHLHYGDADGVAAVGATIPAGRMATPADVAQACLFLASPAAEFVSGSTLTVHGGGERPAFLAASNAAQPR
ncbi:SDR family oxidoreductase [Actinophytocola sp.]|jgi:NAD(P)-dependent dehydrogenase (short-subunit alcohol dehydrogenase family)|uniref:SDR family oxidoreductase n=1 Tax=Actinophytocola sp. TaxID=1872138 RepID=UPI002ED7B2FB